MVQPTEELVRLVVVAPETLPANLEQAIGLGRLSWPLTAIRRLADKMLELADGRVFDSSEALKLKLVDQIGYWDDAVEKMAGLLGEKDIKVVRYENHVNIFDRLLNAETHAPALSLESLTQAARPKLQYLWQP